jgi:N-acetylneuraminic acid mutarotase
VIGGQKGQDAAEVPQAAVEVYDPATNGWTSAAALPFGRSHIAAATAVWRGRIVTFGGETTFGTAVANVSAYNPETNSWSDVTPLPAKRSSGIAAIVNDAVYYSGGLLSRSTWKGTLS